MTFDCAKQWDKFQENYNRITEITIVTPEQMQRVKEKLEGSALDLFNNECASTVNEWAYRTYDEGSVWMMGDQWKVWAFLEQKMKEENLTFFEAGQKYLYNTSSVSTKIISNSEETHSKCGAGTVFDVDVNSCILEKAPEEPAPEEPSTPKKTNSKCSTGTVFDEVSNSCVLV